MLESMVRTAVPTVEVCSTKEMVESKNPSYLGNQAYAIVFFTTSASALMNRGEVLSDSVRAN